MKNGRNKDGFLNLLMLIVILTLFGIMSSFIFYFSILFYEFTKDDCGFLCSGRYDINLYVFVIVNVFLLILFSLFYFFYVLRKIKYNFSISKGWGIASIIVYIFFIICFYLMENIIFALKFLFGRVLIVGYEFPVFTFANLIIMVIISIIGIFKKKKNKKGFLLF